MEEVVWSELTAVLGSSLRLNLSVSSNAEVYRSSLSVVVSEDPTESSSAEEVEAAAGWSGSFCS